MTTMLIDKKKRVSLRWKLNCIFMEILPKEIVFFVNEHGNFVTCMQTKNIKIKKAEKGS